MIVTLAASPAAMRAALVADDAAAEDQHVGRRDAGNAAEQNAPALHRPFEVLGPLLDRHAAGDLAHGRQQGQPALGILQGLVGDGRDARLQAADRQLPRGGEVEVTEDDLPVAEPGDLLAAAAP